MEESSSAAVGENCENPPLGVAAVLPFVPVYSAPEMTNSPIPDGVMDPAVTLALLAV